MVGVKKFHDMTWSDFVSYLNKQRIELVNKEGNGTFGKVFHKRGWDYVVKVIDVDSAYLHFVKYALEHPNKHFPNFVKAPFTIPQFLTRYDNNRDRFTLLKIELLYPLREDIGIFLEVNLQNISESYNDDPTKPVHVYNPINRKWKLYDNCVDLFLFYKEFGLASLVKCNIDLMKNKGGFSEDLHAKNFMQRHGGTIVITDPFANAMEMGYPGMFDDLKNQRPPVISGPKTPSNAQQSMFRFMVKSSK